MNRTLESFINDKIKKQHVIVWPIHVRAIDRRGQTMYDNLKYGSEKSYLGDYKILTDQMHCTLTVVDNTGAEVVDYDPNY
jgi:hypothetical protein